MEALEETLRRLGVSLEKAKGIQLAIQEGEVSLADNLSTLPHGNKTLALVHQLASMSSAVIASLVELEHYYNFLVSPTQDNTTQHITTKHNATHYNNTIRTTLTLTFQAKHHLSVSANSCGFFEVLPPGNLKLPPPPLLSSSSAFRSLFFISPFLFLPFLSIFFFHYSYLLFIFSFSLFSFF